jgi:hypothetical protein
MIRTQTHQMWMRLCNYHNKREHMRSFQPGDLGETSSIARANLTVDHTMLGGLHHRYARI